MSVFLNTKQAAALIGLASNTLQKMRVAGGGPHYRKIGSRVIYAEADVISWVERHPRVSATAETGVRAG